MKTALMRIVVIATVAMTPLTGSAYAQSRPQAPSQLPGVVTTSNSVRVSYADLDTQTPSGFRELGGRINRAVRDVCSHYNAWRHNPGMALECRSDARQNAWRQYADNESQRQHANNDERSQSTDQFIQLAALKPIRR